MVLSYKRKINAPDYPSLHCAKVLAKKNSISFVRVFFSPNPLIFKLNLMFKTRVKNYMFVRKFLYALKQKFRLVSFRVSELEFVDHNVQLPVMIVLRMQESLKMNK